ncbi:hypothetical protein [Natrinema halophilum]|uniref:Uncharacterized protein n=1 Tax=Natrinema halophilum TaxID=1699371 RepID=A0A7D5KMU0_9EURY|nr:hypothetical protein [Natrinema halophilum]QLG51018.1 hypothetical protein HYG82_20390 [Natrinema halophilum]
MVLIDPGVVTSAIHAIYGRRPIDSLDWVSHVAHGIVLGVIVGLFITQEPMVNDGTVFISQSSDKAAWTYLLAFDAKTSEQRWKWQVGKPDEWVGETWQFSSGAAWMTPT